jgi:hypothetical protein
MFKFNHLEYADQTYGKHFRDSMYYSWMSFKSSLYFLIHAVWPDSYKTDGSSTINKLHKKILAKHIDILTKLAEKDNNDNSNDNE